MEMAYCDYNSIFWKKKSRNYLCSPYRVIRFVFTHIHPCPFIPTPCLSWMQIGASNHYCVVYQRWTFLNWDSGKLEQLTVALLVCSQPPSLHCAGTEGLGTSEKYAYNLSLSHLMIEVSSSEAGLWRIWSLFKIWVFLHRCIFHLLINSLPPNHFLHLHPLHQVTEALLPPLPLFVGKSSEAQVEHQEEPWVLDGWALGSGPHTPEGSGNRVVSSPGEMWVSSSLHIFLLVVGFESVVYLPKEPG